MADHLLLSFPDLLGACQEEWRSLPVAWIPEFVVTVMTLTNLVAKSLCPDAALMNVLLDVLESRGGELWTAAGSTYNLRWYVVHLSITDPACRYDELRS
jgi:hypothetical protein